MVGEVAAVLDHPHDLRGDAFSDEQKARDFGYYERLTVRDSSLSASTQAVIAAEVGRPELAYDYLSEAALIDLDDLQHNTRRAPHRIAGGNMDRCGSGLRRDARPRRGSEFYAAPSAGAHPAHLSPLLPRTQAAGSRRTRAGDLFAS
jgi:Glycosyl hydrolase family 65 central catalytic domain